MKIAIIRSYDRDDMSAHICYLSMKKYNIADKYIFFHDAPGDNCPLIRSTGEDIYYHESCGNYGGLKYVKLMISELQKLPSFSEEDYIIFCDSDILILKNVFDYIDSSIDHAGIFGESKVCDNVKHFSGQLNIIKGWLWKEYLQGGDDLQTDLHKFQENNNPVSGTADDTQLSIFSYLKKAKQFSFFGKQCWIHDKIDTKQQYDEVYNLHLR